MASSLTRRLVGAVVLSVAAVAQLAASQAQQPFFWPRAWRSEQFKKDLGLTADQVARIDAIHQSTLPELRQEYDELQKFETKLSRLIESSADEALLARQIDRVETARANLNKTRSLMLARMRLVLNPEQRARLKELYDRQMRDDRSRDGQRRPSDERRPESGGDKPRTPDAGKQQQSVDPSKRPGC